MNLEKGNGQREKGEGSDKQSALPKPDVQQHRIPATTWVWIAALLATLLLGKILPKAPRPTVSRPGAMSLAGPSFEAYVDAERKLRAHFGVEELRRSSPTYGSRDALADDALLDSAVDSYEKLAKDTDLVSIDRRAIVARATAKRPFDNALLENLVADLTKAKTAPRTIETERFLWSSLYGGATAVADKFPTSAEQLELLISMKLGTLEPRALADFHRRSGDTESATREEKRLVFESRRFLVKTIPLNLGLIAAFAVGLFALGVFAVAAIRRRWQWIRRIGTVPSNVGWGSSVDAFVFYLALHQCARFAVGPFRASVPPSAGVLFSVGAEAVVGAIAVGYAAWRARRAGGSLADFGITWRGNVVGNLGYGLLGYCATLPLTLAFGALARLIFHNNTSVAPNPVLPLISSSESGLDRALLFALVAFGAPLFEEIFFRGVLYTGLRAKLTWPLAAAMSSVVFALMHPMQDWLPIFALGFGFATLREMRQSVAPGMLAHFCQNALTYATLAILF